MAAAFGNARALSNPTAASPSFTAPSLVPKAGAVLTFKLTVTDNSGLQSSATCPVHIQWVNTPPVVTTGNNVFIFSKDKGTTMITGMAGDVDGDTLTYQWLEGANVLASGQVSSSGMAPLNLGLIPQLSLGTHTFTLAVDDGYDISQSTMMLTIENSSPTAAPSGEGTYQVATPVTLGGQVADYDGETLSYTWLEGTATLNSGMVTANMGGAPVNLPLYTISSLKVGAHTLTLQVSDRINIPVAKTVTVTIIDTISPTLSPVASQNILWPPNHKMVPVTIQANAADNSGIPAQLAVSIACNESENGATYWTSPVIDQSTGTISLSLMADRFGNGFGRQYTISITAKDDVGNTSTANVKIIVPHDQGKK